mmetsp:Transcript_45974/g.121517  ORF Transcript_45974/g.121517 Transcript_45974/m.121517 type:complete len:157 (-) Transcript_45974:21-491(-)
MRATRALWRSTERALRPFHLAIPVHDLAAAKQFYGGILKLPEGRSSDRWQDYNLFGNQLVVHWVGKQYRGVDYVNPVDGDEVPVPHFGACLLADEFDALAANLRARDVKFVIEPHLRFEGQRGEQKTMFFKDPSNNNLEFKAMTNPDYLFEKQGEY